MGVAPSWVLQSGNTDQPLILFDTQLKQQGRYPRQCGLNQGNSLPSLSTEECADYPPIGQNHSSESTLAALGTR